MKISPLFLTILAFAVTHSGKAEEFTPDHKGITYRGTHYPQFGDHGVELLRFPLPLLAEANPATHGFNPVKARATAGVAIEFSTDSPSVTLHFEAEKFWEYAVYQNGKFSSSGKTGNGKSIQVKNDTPDKLVKFLVVMPNFANPIFTGLETVGNHTLQPVAHAPRKIYAALGDSITHGRGQNVSHETWPWQVAEKLDMELYNVAVGGSNANPHQPTVIADLPKVDLVTILWGYNDWVNRGKTVAQYTEDMKAAITVIRAKHPATPIAILKLLQTKSTESKRTGSQFTADNFRNAAASLVTTLKKSGDSNIHLIESDKMTNTTDDLNDPVHLSVTGAAKLANDVAADLKSILSNQSQ